MANESLASAFKTFTSDSEFKEALRLISFSSEEIPLPAVVNSIIFDILMKNCKKEVANDANAYLDLYLTVLNKNTPTQYDFREVLNDKREDFKDIWSVFLHLVESSFWHHKIVSNNTCDSSNFVKYPNCDILIGFYSKILTKYLSLDNDLFDEIEERFISLLEWINKIYKLTDLRVLILSSLHNLLDKKLQVEFTNDPFSNVYIHLLLKKCPGVFINARNMKAFFAFSNLPFLQAKICEYKLYDLIYKKTLPNKSISTLRKIIHTYCFVQTQSTVEKNERRSCTQTDNLYHPNSFEKRFFLKGVSGQTSLHTFCRKDKFGDLYEVLTQQSLTRPNVKNSVGRTPLHEACLAGSYYCVKFLLEVSRCTEGAIDIKATDNFGLTPLHCAVYMNAKEIVPMLLEREGANIVTLKDKFGEKPKGYAKSRKIKDLLEYYENSVPDSVSEATATNPKDIKLHAPVLKNNEEYSIYLYGLYVILNHYLDSSNLYHKKKVKLLSHKNKMCAHHGENAINTVCDEDMAEFENLPQILQSFSDSVQEKADKVGANVKIGLIPFKMLCGRLVTAA
ncbi:hypothetical protein JTE90_006026 [Oedothorax gibbosus]|uniref:Uncharacterized protein n=1 Tax=Oedothorax gibbosus TaxID=931172 RepID=A0AAV6V0C8_9ARAC|nr:hypothetical protein JTE90_006026 [Oedothorax gibbosus]